jgi:hypothetical protein
VRSVRTVMNKPMEETWGVVSFWIRLWALSGLLFWKFIGKLVKQAVLKIWIVEIFRRFQ